MRVSWVVVGTMGGGLFVCDPPGRGDAGLPARIFVRVGACADELRLIGVARAV